MHAKIATILIIVIFFALSCEKKVENLETQKMDLAMFAKELQALKAKINYGPSQNGQSSSLSTKSTLLNIRAKNEGSLKAENGTCAEITNYIDEEGYDVQIIDWGDEGCQEEWGSFTKGKSIHKSKFTSDTSLIWEDYHENYCCERPDYEYNCTVNSYSITEFQWDSNDPEQWVYRTGEAGGTMTYYNGEVIKYDHNFSDKYNFDLEMRGGTCSYESSLGDTCQWEYTKPVVRDQHCKYFILPTEGTEEGIYNGTAYIIDYGDGTCDNKYTITVDGVTEEIEVEFSEDDLIDVD